MEDLLRKQGIQIPCPNGGSISPMLSPSVGLGQKLQPSPESLTSESSTSHHSFPSEQNSSRGVGILTSSLTGNIRYQPRSSQWTSVLANTDLSVATPLDDEEDSSSIVWLSV
jgi:hypothetical protein